MPIIEAMFTGIIETTGEVVGLVRDAGNIHFDIRSAIGPELKVDQSVSHNGICLTVVRLNRDVHRVTAIDETARKTAIGSWQEGSVINLERCMKANGRFDGHMVQGHVDQTGTIVSILEDGGSWLFDFEYDPAPGNLTVEKGSICIDGISLTCFNTGTGRFRVAIIPYTYENTHVKTLKAGDTVNLEFDIIGKYVQRLLDRP